MAELYTKKSTSSKEMKPKKETVSFLLNYSKALNIVNIGKMKIETIIN